MLAVVASPWMLGGASRIAGLVLEVIVFAGAACWLLAQIAEPATRVRAAGVLVPLAVLGAVMLVQQAPAPKALMDILASRSASVHAAHGQFLEQTGVQDSETARFTGRGGRASASVSPDATRSALSRHLVYALAYLVLANSLRRTSHFRKAALLIVGSTFLLVLVSLAQKLSGTREIYGLIMPYYGGANVFGPFTNRNHYAAYINMALGVAMALYLISRVPADLRQEAGPGDRIVRRMDMPGAGLTLFVTAFAVIAATSVVISTSRGGILALTATCGLIALLAYRRGALQGARWLGVAAAALFVVALVVWLGWKPVISRLGTVTDVVAQPLADSRFVATRDTLSLFAAHPILGCGFGSFQFAFPTFQSPAIQFGRFLHAHNDWAQLLAEAGLAGSLIALWAALSWAGDARRGLIEASERGKQIALGCSAGLFTIALHSAVDYSLHKPANALMLATLCAMITAAARLRPHIVRELNEEPSRETA